MTPSPHKRPVAARDEHDRSAVVAATRTIDDAVRPFAVSTRNFGGLGLGLYLVRWSVTSHGGSVRVESEPNAGATFFVELPLRPPADQSDCDEPPPA